nr:hypothetical protein Hi04_10k_c3807_00017 [uncultured bacterium]
MLAEYTALLGEQKNRELTLGEKERVELLRDVLLETGAILDAEAAHQRRRTPRAAVVAEVAFATAQDAARAYSTTREVGTGGMTLLTGTPLAKGTSMELSLQVAGWDAPMSVLGEVAWCKDGAVGVAFKNLTPEDTQRLRMLVAEHSSFLDRLRSSLATRGPTPIQAAVTTHRVLIMRLRDKALADAATEILGLNGCFIVEAPPPDIAPHLIVADGDAEFLMPVVVKYPRVPIVLVNVAGPESLMGKLMTLRPSAYVKKPATPAEILQAVRAVLGDR